MMNLLVGKLFVDNLTKIEWEKVLKILYRNIGWNMLSEFHQIQGMWYDNEYDEMLEDIDCNKYGEKIPIHVARYHATKIYDDILKDYSIAG